MRLCLCLAVVVVPLLVAAAERRRIWWRSCLAESIVFAPTVVPTHAIAKWLTGHCKPLSMHRFSRRQQRTCALTLTHRHSGEVSACKRRVGDAEVSDRLVLPT